jgi:hypothetical protein
MATDWDEKELLDLQTKDWIIIAAGTFVLVCIILFAVKCLCFRRAEVQEKQYYPEPQEPPSNPEPISFVNVPEEIEITVAPGPDTAVLCITRESLETFYDRFDPQEKPHVEMILEKLETNEILEQCLARYEQVPETTMVYRPAVSTGAEADDLVMLSGDFKFQNVTITRASLVEFYSQYNPSKLDEVDEILANYDPNILMKELQDMYGAVPQGSIVVSPNSRRQYTFRPAQSKQVAFLPPASQTTLYPPTPGMNSSSIGMLDSSGVYYSEQEADMIGCAPPRSPRYSSNEAEDFGCGTTMLFGPERRQ